jgi:hypothetical protein
MHRNTRVNLIIYISDVRNEIFNYLINEYKIPLEKLFTREDKKEKKLYKA